MPWPLIIFVAAMLIAAIVGAAACRAILYEFRDAVHRSPLCGACGYSRVKIPDWQPCPECGVDRPDALERRLTPRPWRVRWVIVPAAIIALAALGSAIIGAPSALGWGLLALAPSAAACFVERRARVSRDRTLTIWFVIIPLALTMLVQTAAVCASFAILQRMVRVPFLGSAAYAALASPEALERVWLALGILSGVAVVLTGFWQAITAFCVYARMDRETNEHKYM